MSNKISSQQIVELQDKIEQEFSILLSLVIGIKEVCNNGTYISGLTFQSDRIETILTEINDILNAVKEEKSEKNSEVGAAV